MNSESFQNSPAVYALLNRTIRTSALRIAAFACLLPVMHVDALFAQGSQLKLLSADTGWLLTLGKLYWTSNNGGHWSDITPKMSLPREKIAAVYFRNPQEGWVLLSTDENQGPEARFELASTTNSGASWGITQVDIPEPGPPNRAALPGEGFLFFLDLSHGWINLMLEGSQNFSPALLLSTVDGGKSWTRRTSPGRGVVTFVNDADGWIAGGPGERHLYFTRNGGLSWQENDINNPPEVGGGTGGLYTVPVFFDLRNGFVTVTLPSAGAIVLFKTNDGGNSWQPNTIVKDTIVERYGIPVPSAVLDSAWLIAKADDSSMSVVRAQFGPNTNGLETRTAVVQRLPSSSSVLNLSFVTPDNGWILADRLYSTETGGWLWKDITPWPGIVIVPALPDK